MDPINKYSAFWSLGDIFILDPIKEILKTGWFRYSGHCHDRMCERGATHSDLMHAIQTGCLCGSERDEKHNNWKYLIEGSDTRGGNLIVIAALTRHRKGVYFLTIY